jgi:hypothetical protein
MNLRPPGGGYCLLSARTMSMTTALARISTSSSLPAVSTPYVSAGRPLDREDVLALLVPDVESAAQVKESLFQNVAHAGLSRLYESRNISRRGLNA